MTKRGFVSSTVIACALLLALMPTLLACSNPTPAPAPAPTTAAPAPAPTAAAPSSTAAPTTPAASGQTVTWVFNFDNPSQTHFSSPLLGKGGRFEQLLTQYSDGRFKLDIKERLIPSAEQIKAIGDNRAQLGHLRVDWNAGTFPLWDISALPFWFNDPWEYEKFELDPAVQKIWDANYRKVGLVKVCSIVSDATDLIWAHKPVNTLDSFKGLKTRTPGLVGTETLKAMGAAPLTIGDADFDEAFIRGTVDAAVSSTSYGLARGLFITAEYVATWPFAGAFEIPLIANAKAYDALPPDLKKAFDDAAAEASRQEFFAWKGSKLAIASCLASFKKSPAIPAAAELQKAKDLTKPVIDWWVKVSGSDAQTLLDISKKYASGAR